MVIQQRLNILGDRMTDWYLQNILLPSLNSFVVNRIPSPFTPCIGRSKGYTLARLLWEALKWTAIVFASLSLTWSGVSKGRGWVWVYIPMSQNRASTGKAVLNVWWKNEWTKKRNHRVWCSLTKPFPWRVSLSLVSAQWPNPDPDPCILEPLHCLQHCLLLMNDSIFQRVHFRFSGSSHC